MEVGAQMEGTSRVNAEETAEADSGDLNAGMKEGTGLKGSRSQRAAEVAEVLFYFHIEDPRAADEMTV